MDISLAKRFGKLRIKKRQRYGFAAVPFEKREKREKRECVSRVRSDFCFLLLTGDILPWNYDQNIPWILTTHEPLLHSLAVVVVSGKQIQLGGGNVPLGAVHGGLGL